MNYFDPSGICVLSLFSGIEIALVAVKQLGIKIKKWVTVENDQDAIEVTKAQHFDLIKEGILILFPDIIQLNSENVSELGPFHLVIGGSPCQDFSFQGNLNGGERAGMEGERGRLAYEYFRVLRLVERDNHRRKRSPPAFVFENVNGMSEDVKAKIGDWLEVAPVCLQADLVSPAARPRDFYTNLKLTELPNSTFSPTLQQILISPAEALRLKAKCIITSNGVEVFGTNRENEFYENEKRWIEPFNRVYRLANDHDAGFRNLTITECERCFGLNDGYCGVLGGTKSVDIQRQWRLLGNAFSMPVIVHLLSTLRRNFPGKSFKNYPIEIRLNKDETDETDEESEHDTHTDPKGMEVELYKHVDVIDENLSPSSDEETQTEKKRTSARVRLKRAVVSRAKKKSQEANKAEEESDNDDNDEGEFVEIELSVVDGEDLGGKECDRTSDNIVGEKNPSFWTPGIDSLTTNWVCCDLCDEWRIIPNGIEFKDAFQCDMNRWAKKGENCCVMRESSTPETPGVPKSRIITEADMATFRG